MTAVPRAVLDGIATVSAGDDEKARDLIRRWRVVLRESSERAERIRQQVAESRCSCEFPAAGSGERCSRCWGLAEEARA
jgi:hypothetical protein